MSEKKWVSFEEFKKEFDAKTYQEYAVSLFLYDIAGGTPADPKMIEGWINATNKDKSEEERKKLIDATIEELPDLAEDKEAKSWVRFKRDKKGPYLEGRCVKAALKEAANIVKSLVNVTDKKGNVKTATALGSKVAECVFVVERRVYLRNPNGEIISNELETHERPVHAMTRLGPRTSIKRSDVVEDLRIDFTVRLAKTGAVSETALFSALSYLEYLGIGADRSQGRGRSKEIKVERK